MAASFMFALEWDDCSCLYQRCLFDLPLVFQSRDPCEMAARIFRPAKTAMQSGSARTKEWVLEFVPAQAREIDPLMGWTSSTDMKAQVRLEFDSKEDAIDYAERNGLAFSVQEPKPRKPVAKSYADNFKFGRLRPWTH